MISHRYKKKLHIDSDVLSQYLVHYGNLAYFKTIFRHKLIPKDYSLDWIYENGNVWYSTKDILLWKNIVRKGGNRFIRFIIRKLRYKIREIEKISVSGENYETIMDKMFRMGACTIANTLMEEAGQELADSIFLKYRLTKKDKMSLLFQPARKTRMVAEALELQAIAGRFRKKQGGCRNGDLSSPEVKKILDRHLERYAFLKMNYFGGSPYSIEDLKNMVRENWNLKNKKADRFALPRIAKADQEFFGLMREMICLRTERNEAITYACWLMRPVLQGLAGKMGIRYEDLIFLAPDEIKEGKINLRTISQRKKGFGMLCREGRIKILAGKELEGLGRELKSGIRKENIEGLPVYPGKVKGKVQIINDPKEYMRFKRGRILVTKYTTPAFAPLMQKSAAIVTDLGGITSHAAIVAREFGIPCIVGTRIATKALKDRDLIEVDAEKGTVKKLE